MKYGLNKIILGLSLSVVFGVFFVTGVNAASTLTGVDTNVIAECKEKLQAAVAIQPKPLPNGDVDTSNVDKALEKASAECLESATTDAAKAQISQMIIQSTDEVARDVAKVARRAALAGAWKAMWSAFSQQLAYDTATWIASGGEGQQPLFVTEGWSAYLKNTADNAIGTFIDQIDSRLGYDLCEPDFNLKIPLIQSLDPRAPRKARCTFTKMMDNWQNAINNPNYTYEYVNFLQPGENDLSTFLILQTDINDEVDRKMSQAFLEAIVGQGWKDITDFTGKILTPGSTVRAWLENSPIVNQKMPENEVFTNTIYDFIETFLNTLVGKLLNKLQSGLFDDGNSSGSSLDINDINNLLQDANSRFASLLNPEAQPYFEGRQGAQTRMGDIIEGEITVGGPYEILNELTQCTNANNPGPSECVVDQIFAQKVREKTLIRDLPDSILNRKFVPPVDEVFNPQEAFTLRNIIILRKYRIVPVGWEIAARYLDERRDKSYSLGDLMRGFDNSDSPFYQLVDPYWVLKAPELFCRREGFGPLSSYFGANSQSVRRDTYCADEQQCLREDRDGNCIAYGYCTEEKRVWD
ncbi:MAG TPA: hypothetical protein VJB67_02540, partial [Patescibacteria group bacterium]|nr:hypothetical protein [Patescibacteria group bacterium]